MTDQLIFPYFDPWAYTRVGLYVAVICIGTENYYIPYVYTVNDRLSAYLIFIIFLHPL